MKEATGELNMTVVTLVAVAAIGAVFYFVVWPLVQRTLITQSCRTAYGNNFVAARAGEDDDHTGGQSQATIYVWQCCERNDQGNMTNCQPYNDDDM